MPNEPFLVPSLLLVTVLHHTEVAILTKTVLWAFLATAMLSGMRRRLGVILICISPVTGDSEPFKVVLVSLCVSSVYNLLIH